MFEIYIYINNLGPYRSYKQWALINKVCLRSTYTFLLVIKIHTKFRIFGKSGKELESKI